MTQYQQMSRQTEGPDYLCKLQNSMFVTSRNISAEGVLWRCALVDNSLHVGHRITYLQKEPKMPLFGSKKHDDKKQNAGERSVRKDYSFKDVLGT